MPQDSDPRRALGDESEPPAAPQRAVSETPVDRPGRARRYAAGGTFPASLGWPLAGTVVPGVGLLRTRWKAAGLVMLLGYVLAIAIVGLAWVFSRDTLIGWAVDPQVLTAVWIGLVAVGVVWAASIVVTHLALRPPALPGWQRLVGALAVGVLTLAVVLPTFVGARAVYDTRALIQGVFTPDDPAGAVTPDPSAASRDAWAATGRLNVLILGGDSGQARDEALGARTDTVIVASIATDTGATTLFSLPRQTQRVPFPEGSALAARWPRGFTRGVSGYDPEYALNAMYNAVPQLAPTLMPTGVRDPGAAVMKDAVGAALGLDISYYAMVDMDGFIEFINALGGITVNINAPVAVGGASSTNTPPDRWLPPGPDQHLNGFDALWYARGRFGATDYERMSRQRCVIRAVARQADPATVLANYEALSKAGNDIVATDVPNSQLPALLQLAWRVKGQQMTSVSFENDRDGFSTNFPDWDLVRERVRAALNPPSPTPEPAPSATQTTEAPAPSPTPTASETPAAPTDECAYHPTWQTTP